MNNMASAREELDKAVATPARRSVEDGPVRTHGPQSARERKENSTKVMNVMNSVASDKLAIGRLSDDEYGTDDDAVVGNSGRGGRLTVITKDLFNEDDDDDSRGGSSRYYY